MASIKRFFAKKKLDVKFKKAGTGHTLTGGSGGQSVSPRGGGTSSSVSAVRSAPTGDSQRAGQAALDRFQTPKPVPKARTEAERQIRRELEAERALEKLQISPGAKLVEKDAVPMANVVLFNCPDVGPAVLPKNGMDEYIKEFLNSQLEDEPEMTSAVMIHTFNKDKEKVKICVDTVSKYLENIIANPGEEKYCKIKISNKIFQDRVACMEGSKEFLFAVGFQKKNFIVNEEEVEFYWLDEESALLTERLVNIREILMAAEPIKAQLDRAMKIFDPSMKSNQFDIPAEFYTVSPEEIKREHELRQEAVEKMGMLRTKAMRERDELRELRRYRYTLIRIRFPDGVTMQATFRAHEKLTALFEFITENISNDWIPFNLTTMTGQVMSRESTQSLVELGLAPSVILNFSWDASVMADVTSAQGKSVDTYLKPEVMACIETL